MPQFLINKLKAEYPKNPGAVYGTLNKIGAMRGNKETPLGAAMQAKHDVKVAKAKPLRAVTPHTGFRSVMSGQMPKEPGIRWGRQ